MKLTQVVCNPRILVLCLCLLLAISGQAQQMSGSISGTVKDGQGAVIPGAKILLVDQEKASQRKMDTSAEGSFVFDLLAPSTYTLTIEAAGFKKWEKKDIKLYASDRIGVNDVVMQLGQITDTVTVEATTAQLQTESAKIEGTVTSQQFNDISVRDRNFMYLLRTIPGVVPDNMNGRAVNINGGRNDQTSFKLDGLANTDYGDNGCCAIYSSMDTIAEMKVITNGATADMGTLGANQVIVVTKSGSKEYHGSGYFYKRAEWLNANSWGNNRALPTPTPKGRDRNNQGGFTLGGPITIPGVLNTSKDKLFFFVNAELWKNLSPNITRIWVPTADERNGNMLQSVWPTNNSEMIPLDPGDATGNRTPFPDRLIPVSRQNKDMVALMKLYPLPNAPRQAVPNSFNNFFNYYSMNSPNYDDRLMQSYRVDYNLSEKWRIYGRFSKDYTENGSPTSGNASALANFQFDSTGKEMGWSLQYRNAYSGMINITTIINPTTTNEVVLGGTGTKDHHYADKVTYLRSRLGLGFQVPYPQAVQGDYGPVLTLGGNGFSNGPRMGTNRPSIAFSPDWNVTDNYTKVMTRHTLKLGAFFAFNRKDQDPWDGTNYSGTIAIGRSLTDNPYDTDTTWGNLLTGTFNQFDQVPKRIEGRYFFKQLEWYVNDTWKAKPNLTVDMGVRFYMMQPQYDSKGQIAVFRPDLWDPTKTVRLYARGFVNGRSSVVDPAYPSVAVPSYMVDTIVAGSGNPNNGFVLAGTNGVPKGMLSYQGILGAPRLGISWQPGFLPKTVIRASSGVFYDRIQGNAIFNSIGLPPTNRPQQLRYGLVSDISNARATLLTAPGPLGGYIGSGKIPTTVTWNFAVQRELPRSITFEVAYVGQNSRHLITARPYNEAGFGAAWLPWTQNPVSNPQKFDGTTNADYKQYRPYRGIDNLRQYESLGTSNYHAMQVQINKRMSRKLSFGVAYTFSKTMGEQDGVWGNVNQFDVKAYNYGRVSYDRTHILNINYIYNLPKFGKNGNFLDHPGIRLVLNDWELSGTVGARSGGPSNFSYGFQNGVSDMNREYTGTPHVGPRPIFVGDWVLPGDQKAYNVQFNTKAFVPAPRPVRDPVTGIVTGGSLGLESGFNYWSNPPIFLSSPELSIMKNIVFSKDSRRYFQIRLETYNTLNHHDWNTRNMRANFNSPTDLTIVNYPTPIAEALGIRNPNGTVRSGGDFGFGSLDGAERPRTVQATLKLYF